MISLRYDAGKVWLNFACAVVGGVVAVAVIGLLWDGAVLTGGIAGIVVVIVMLLPGVIKRGARREPFLVVDGRGITIEPCNIGTIPWSRVRGTSIAGVPWVTGLRLRIDFTGAAPKLGFMAKLNWGLYAKQRGEVARITLGFIDMTDQTKSDLEKALSRSSVPGA